MATEKIFREMQRHLLTLQEALEALGTTVDEDKPTRDDVVVASRLSDDLLAVRGLFEETVAAAEDACGRTSAWPKARLPHLFAKKVLALSSSARRLTAHR